MDMHNLENHKIALIYFSSNGSTRKAMEMIAEGMQESEHPVEMLDVGEYIRTDNLSRIYNMIPGYSVIVFGTPTYFHHPPPLFKRFINMIPPAGNNQSAGLVSTFGGVCSGVVLSELAKILENKGYKLLGGIKILAEHSLMFQGGNPLGYGHPNISDFAIIREFCTNIIERAAQDHQGYEAGDFNDKSSFLRFLDATVINMKSLSVIMPTPKVDHKLCIKCKKCVQTCPVANITLNEYPEHGEGCISCYNCVRNCPQGATRAPLKTLESILRLLAKIFGRNERLQTEQII